MLVILGVTAASGGATAAPLAAPAGTPVLTVSGAVGNTNADASAVFDREMLERLGMVTVETTTPWYNESMRFEGVPLTVLMAAVAAKGERLLVTALNDYGSEVPVEDLAKYNVILAMKRNGEYMTVRDKGPLFIVYDFDRNPEIKNQKYYTRCVWQVKSIEIK
jgi:hypothetical protein